ncbi:MAG TPA: hypothetical protein PK111_00470 [Atribacterota bacterium]|nr:hypothetical protein [Atribacterota bacterium]
MSANEKQSKKCSVNRSLFYLLFAILYLIPMTVFFIDGFKDVLHFFRRITGLTAVVSLFIAIMLTLLVKESKKLFGVYFLKIHHFFAFIGLLLISLHPVFMALDFGTTEIFIPDFSSWQTFFKNGGPLALYLIYIAVIAALLNKKITKSWKYIHALMYPAFLLGTVHGIWKGSDMGNPMLSFLYTGLIVAVFITFFYKRYQKK